MPNALAAESSPYLLQHRDNPVDWLPWGPEALRRAAELDRPLLISIGYSACHWCHVMERESFEDPEVAGLMNAEFVCVKVDREERPDVDAVYMEAVQAMTGQGGWPLNVFATPGQVPFFGGTYFPPEARHGMPSWPDVLRSVAAAWRDRRREIEDSAEEVRARLAGTSLMMPSPDPFDARTLDDAVRLLAEQFDESNAGFGGAPKFPPSCVLRFLLARSAGSTPWSGRALEMSTATLTSMASGGIHDIVGGGFARYAVDRTWTVPHFEKMLYDNALLLRAYTHAWQATGDDLFARTADGIATWALTEMRAPEGGFYSALDADSEGEEGLFYVWTEDELKAALGELEQVALGWLTPAPFEGRLILEARGQVPQEEQRQEIRRRLLDARSTRVRPGLDDKRLAAWNALMIGALAESGAAFDRPDWVQAAGEAAAFVLGQMRDDAGRLLRTSDGRTAKLNAYLEDHAFLLEALIDLYEATFEPRWFAAAREIAEEMIERFGDDRNGGFLTTSHDHEELVARRRDLDDNPIPSGSSSAAFGLLRLAALTGERTFGDKAIETLRITQEIAPRHPQAFGHLLVGLDFLAAEVQEVALAGDDVEPLARALRSRLLPHVVVAGPPGDGVPLMEGRVPVDGRAAAYVCRQFSCRQPVTDPGDLLELVQP